MDAAMDEAAFQPIREAWPDCKSSNYNVSSAYDGDGDPARLRPPVVHEWYSFSYRMFADMAAPRCYWRIPFLWLPGEKHWEATVRDARDRVSRSGASYGLTPSDVCPWIQLVGCYARWWQDEKKTMSKKCMYHMLSMLEQERVQEMVIWSNMSTQETNEHWNTFIKCVDAIWGQGHTDYVVEQGESVDEDPSLLNGGEGMVYRISATPSANGTRRVRLRLGFSLDPEEPTDEIKVVLKSMISKPTGSGKIRLRNWTTGNDDLVESFQVTNDLSKEKAKVAWSTYVDAEGRVEVVLSYDHNDSFKAKIDLVRVTTVVNEVE
jgi:hypothetical protein